MLAKQEQMSGDASADSNVCVGDYSFDEAVELLEPLLEELKRG